jgi:hypothetical protein
MSAIQTEIRSSGGCHCCQDIPGLLLGWHIISLALSLGMQNMPLFFFHQHLNGRLEKDRIGRRFPSVDDARVYAVHRIPAILRKTVSSTTNTYVATEVSDGEHTLCVVRAKVIIQR